MQLSTTNATDYFVELIKKYSCDLPTPTDTKPLEWVDLPTKYGYGLLHKMRWLVARICYLFENKVVGNVVSCNILPLSERLKTKDIYDKEEFRVILRALRCFPNLTNLTMMGVGIDKLPSTIYRFYQLTSICLTYNKLTEISSCLVKLIKNSEKLESIDLSNNQIPSSEFKAIIKDIIMIDDINPEIIISLLKHLPYHHLGDYNTIKLIGTNNVERVRLLLAHDVSLYKSNKSAVITAIQNNNPEMVKLLLENKFYATDEMCLEEAVASNNIAIVTMLLDHGCRKAECAIQPAVKCNNRQMIDLLLSRGCPSGSAITAAVYYSPDVSLIEYLLKKGCHIRCTAFDHAVAHMQENHVNVLFRHGYSIRYYNKLKNISINDRGIMMVQFREPYSIWENNKQIHRRNIIFIDFITKKDVSSVSSLLGRCLSDEDATDWIKKYFETPLDICCTVYEQRVPLNNNVDEINRIMIEYAIDKNDQILIRYLLDQDTPKLSYKTIVKAVKKSFETDLLLSMIRKSDCCEKIYELGEYLQNNNEDECFDKIVTCL
jgi:hypothetical protein